MGKKVKISTYSPNSNVSSNPLKLTRKEEIVSVRVVDIILDSDHPKFIEYGGWNSIGTIFFSPVKYPGLKLTKTSLSNAKPLLSNTKLYPLINEIVSVIALASTTSIGQDSTEVSLYYFPPINIWNSQHHNALPDSTVSQEDINEDYELSEVAGFVRRVKDEGTEISLGKTFQEKSNVYPLKPFEGDYILEGRWGNSIRFGSTVPNSNNTWSSSGEPGDPILILKNSGASTAQPGWVPTVESLNIDDSSIYLTSTQQLSKFFPSSTKIAIQSGIDKITIPNQYIKPQIILNSGQLALNSWSDSIFLSSAQFINVAAEESIGLIAKKHIILEGSQIFLGAEDPNLKNPITQPLILGEDFLDDFAKLLNALDNLADAIKYPTAVGGVVQSLATIAPSFKQSISNLRTNAGLSGAKFSPDPKNCKYISKVTRTL